MQLIFDRRIPRRRGQPATRTRVLTQDVNPSLHVSHRNTRVKQYWKLNRALRTETTFNDTYDFRIGRKLENLPKLIELGRDINRRLLVMERESCRPAPAASLFEALVMPTGEPGRRAPGLRFGDPRVVGLFCALSQFRSIFGGFYARDLRPLVEQHQAADRLGEVVKRRVVEEADGAQPRRRAQAALEQADGAAAHARVGSQLLLREAGGSPVRGEQLSERAFARHAGYGATACRWVMASVPRSTTVAGSPWTPRPRAVRSTAASPGQAGSCARAASSRRPWITSASGIPWRSMMAM